MYIMQQYRDTALAERWDNAFALCYRRIWLHFRLSIRYMT